MALHPTSDPPHRASVLQRSSLEVAYIPVFGVRLLAASKPLRPERDALKFPQVAHRSETNACMRRPIPGGQFFPRPELRATPGCSQSATAISGASWPLYRPWSMTTMGQWDHRTRPRTRAMSTDVNAPG
jgi:hypothetical protein